ncbi:MAG TPA: hypothetical protein VF799_10765 [Geobacteraceae bacterium]
MDTDNYDSLLIRCPRLGGEVTFAYCRVEAGDLPCGRIVVCWQGAIPIADYLQKRLAPDQAERFYGERPKEKLATLVELAETARGARD